MHISFLALRCAAVSRLKDQKAVSLALCESSAEDTMSIKSVTMIHFSSMHIFLSACHDVKTVILAYRVLFGNKDYACDPGLCIPFHTFGFTYGY